MLSSSANILFICYMSVRVHGYNLKAYQLYFITDVLCIQNRNRCTQHGTQTVVITSVVLKLQVTECVLIL